MTVYPEDGCTFWYTNDYYATTGSICADTHRLVPIPVLHIVRSGNWHRHSSQLFQKPRVVGARGAVGAYEFGAVLPRLFLR